MIWRIQLASFPFSLHHEHNVGRGDDSVLFAEQVFTKIFTRRLSMATLVNYSDSESENSDSGSASLADSKPSKKRKFAHHTSITEPTCKRKKTSDHSDTNLKDLGNANCESDEQDSDLSESESQEKKRKTKTKLKGLSKPSSLLSHNKSQAVDFLSSRPNEDKLKQMNKAMFGNQQTGECREKANEKE